MTLKEQIERLRDEARARGGEGERIGVLDEVLALLDNQPQPSSSPTPTDLDILRQMLPKAGREIAESYGEGETPQTFVTVLGDAGNPACVTFTFKRDGSLADVASTARDGTHAYDPTAHPQSMGRLSMDELTTKACPDHSFEDPPHEYVDFAVGSKLSGFHTQVYLCPGRPSSSALPVIPDAVREALEAGARALTLQSNLSTARDFGDVDSLRAHAAEIRAFLASSAIVTREQIAAVLRDGAY